MITSGFDNDRDGGICVSTRTTHAYCVLLVTSLIGLSKRLPVPLRRSESLLAMEAMTHFCVWTGQQNPHLHIITLIRR